MRVDGVLVLGDELIDIGTGLAVTEPAWRFLGLGPWSRQDWEPEAVPPGAQGPSGADRCETRLWDGLLVVGKHGGNRGDPSMLVEARDAASREVAWQHRVSGAHDVAMWSAWLNAMDGTVLERQSAGTLYYPDIRTGGCRWALSWHTLERREGQPADDTGEIVTVFDSGQPVVSGIDAGSGRVLWRAGTPEGTIPVAVRACGDYVIVCSFPEDTDGHLFDVSHAPAPPIVLAGACACKQPVASSDEPNSCGRCGGFLAPWMTVTVHDRHTGAALWSHRWPWHDDLGILAEVQALTIADSAFGWVIVTQEGPVLYARRLADQALLWSLPVSSLADLPPQPPGPTFTFHWMTGRALPGWAWLQRDSGSAAAGTRTTADLLIHPVTGEHVGLTDVLYVSDEGLAVTVTGDTITCHALGQGPPFPADWPAG